MPVQDKLGLPYAEARAAAEALIAELRPAFARLEVAGSIRRRQPYARDIELVGIVRSSPAGLFGEEAPDAAMLERTIAAMVGRGDLAWDTDLRRNGERYKRFRAPAHGGVAVDLFITTAERWGNILAIRTGCAEMSELLVTAALRRGLRHEDGALMRGDELIPCPAEIDFFSAVAVPYIEPASRSAETAAALDLRDRQVLALERRAGRVWRAGGDHGKS